MQQFLSDYGPTIMSILGIVYAAVRGIMALVPTPRDPGTNEPDAKLVNPLLGVIGKLLGLSMTEGVKSKPGKSSGGSGVAGMLILCFTLSLFAGCVGTNTSFTPWATTASNQPANVTEMDADGLQRGVYQGVGATNFKADADGIYAMTPGTGSMITKGGTCVYLPGDMTAEKMSYDGTVFKAEKLTISYSAPLKVQADAFTVAAAAIQGMTQIEATKQIAIWVEIGKITQTVADALLKYFVPTLPTVSLPIAPTTAAPDAPPPVAALAAEPVIYWPRPTSECGI